MADPVAKSRTVPINGFRILSITRKNRDLVALTSPMSGQRLTDVPRSSRQDKLHCRPSMPKELDPCFFARLGDGNGGVVSFDLTFAALDSSHHFSDHTL